MLKHVFYVNFFFVFKKNLVSSPLPIPSLLCVCGTITGKGILSWKAGFKSKTFNMILFIVYISFSKKKYSFEVTCNLRDLHDMIAWDLMLEKGYIASF